MNSDIKYRNMKYRVHENFYYFCFDNVLIFANYDNRVTFEYVFIKAEIYRGSLKNLRGQIH